MQEVLLLFREGAKMSYCFSDRYDEIKILYQSAATTVTLVSSEESDELLLMKCVHKQAASSPTSHQEADLLERLSHPGIPRLIDRYEDDRVCVIVEEYFSGEPLEQYLLCNQHISQETFIQFAIQLCEIILYLHMQEPDPVLYLDMKPGHVIVCKDRIKLIDYGTAKILSSSGNTFQNYGTKKYAAPEQLQGQQPDMRTDVYGIGKMLCLMAKYTPFSFRVRLWPMLYQATRHSGKKRTASVKDLIKQLQDIAPGKNGKYSEQKHLLKTIAVAGSEHGVGCTHIAIALVCHLNQAGFSAYYRNETGQQVVERILQQKVTCKIKDGIIYHDNFRGMILYGPGIQKTDPPEGIQVTDWGCRQQRPDADVTIYVCSGTLWLRQDRLPSWVGENTVVLCNHLPLIQGRAYARQLDHKIYLFPYQENPWNNTLAVRTLFSRMIRKEHLL
jgi:serine/threonine-protein kinase